MGNCKKGTGFYLREVIDIVPLDSGNAFVLQDKRLSIEIFLAFMIAEKIK